MQYTRFLALFVVIRSRNVAQQWRNVCHTDHVAGLFPRRLVRQKRISVAALQLVLFDGTRRTIPDKDGARVNRTVNRAGVTVLGTRVR